MDGWMDDGWMDGSNNCWVIFLLTLKGQIGIEVDMLTLDRIPYFDVRLREGVSDSLYALMAEQGGNC